jgi:hypothetical protein
VTGLAAQLLAFEFGRLSDHLPSSTLNHSGYDSHGKTAVAFSLGKQ